MTTIQELVAIAGQIGLEGQELRDFVREQQATARAEREAEREEKAKERQKEENERAKERQKEENERAAQKEENERQFELEKLKLTCEMRKIEVQAMSEGSIDGTHSADVVDEDDNTGQGGLPAPRGREARGPKMTPFDERDDMGSYIHRFERYAVLQKWKKDDWAVYLAALLKGRALDVYARLAPSQASDYEVLKQALLRRYALTEEGYKQKFYDSKPEKGESPQQFIVRLEDYFLRWIELAKVDQTFDDVKELLVRERYLATCPKTLELFLRERAVTSLEELGKIAEQYEDAHGGLDVSRKERKSSPFRKHTESKKPEVKASGSPKRDKPRCFVCNRVGHRARDCFQRAKVGAMQQVEPRRGTWNWSSNRGRGRGFHQPFQGPRQGQTDSQSAEGTTGPAIYCRSHGKALCTECFVDKPMVHTCNAMLSERVRMKCGCELPVVADACMIAEKVKDNMPVMDGQLDGRKVRVLRDSGCSTVVVRRELVPDDKLTGKTSTCVMIDGTLRSFPTARIDIDTPYLSGNVEAVCMKRPLYDVIVGNVEGVHEAASCESVCEDRVSEEIEAVQEVEEVQAVVTRAQSQKEQKTKLLKVAESIDGNVSTEEISKLQRQDETLQKWFEEAERDLKEDSPMREVRFEVKNGLLWRKKESEKRVTTQLVVPVPLREKVMKLAHDSIMSGHQGVKKTSERVTVHFFWPGVHGDVTRYCRSCDICQRTVSKGRVPVTPLGKMPLIEVPFKRVAIDLVGPIAPVTDRGNRYILTMVDYATRYPEATALKCIDAETVAEALVTMFTRVGIPQEILSDQGSQFLSGVMKEVSRLLSMNQLVTTPYHPMCNGLVERFNGTLKMMLKRMCAERPKDWDRYLPALLFAYREVPQESLGFSPFEMLYGRTVRGPMAILKEVWTKESAEPEVKLTYQYVLELQERLQETCEVAKQELMKAQGKQKKHFDVKSRERKFKEGDKVLLLLPTDGNKLLMQWKGPFQIVECRNDNNYRIQLEGRVKMFHANMLKRYVERKQEGSVEVLGAAVIEEGGDIDGCEMVRLVGEQKETWKDVNVNPQLSGDQRKDVNDLLEEFEDIFTDVPKVTNLGEHKVELTSTDPIRSKAYPLPYAMREAVDKELDSMLASGIIEPSTAPYASPIVVVKKHDGSSRICIDYRKLNNVTIFDPEPMPQMQDIFAELSGCQYFSKFDFCKGYWQVPMRNEDKDVTTFVTHRGLFRFKVMPFGLVNAPATFSRIMRKLLEGLRQIKNYLDDVLDYTKDWSGHLQNLRQFFLRVREANLACKPSKCFVGFTELVFLGHMIGQRGVFPSEDLVDKVRKATRPTTKKQLRSFLGLVGYYRAFVPNFAAIAVPLTDLTKKGCPNELVWTDIHENAFVALKQCVCQPPVLRLPNVNKPFILQTDASSEGIGAILLQEEGSVKHPVAFASKKLLPREKNYSTIEREALAIVWGVQKFENYLMGVHFYLETDHHPLQYLHQARFQNSRIMRWSLILQSYRFTVRAIKGSENVGADFLSRFAE